SHSDTVIVEGSIREQVSAKRKREISRRVISSNHLRLIVLSLVLAAAVIAGVAFAYLAGEIGAPTPFEALVNEVPRVAPREVLPIKDEPQPSPSEDIVEIMPGIAPKEEATE